MAEADGRRRASARVARGAAWLAAGLAGAAWALLGVLLARSDVGGGFGDLGYAALAGVLLLAAGGVLLVGLAAGVVAHRAGERGAWRAPLATLAVVLAVTAALTAATRAQRASSRGPSPPPDAPAPAHPAPAPADGAP